MGSKTYNYTDPTKYTLSDSDKIEISGGVAKLKDQRPADATFYADYASNINGNWGGGTLTGTATGGAAVSGGKLDLAHGDIRYVTYDADGNADSQQTGCIRFKVTPNYSGSPAGNRTFFTISKENNSTLNLIQLFHKTTGGLQLNIYNSAGGVITAQTNTWNPTASTEYEIEVNYDITAGATRIFIDGTQFGATIAATGTRDASIGLLRIGSSRNGTQSSDFKIDDFLVFSTVQHTANYTPDWTGIPASVYATDNPSVKTNETFAHDGLEGFTETSIITGSDILKHVVGKDGTDYWYNSSTGAWETSSGYSQSNTAAEIYANMATFSPDVGVTSYVKSYLHSDDGSTTPQLDSIVVDYDFFPVTPASVPHKTAVHGYIYDPVAGQFLSGVTIKAILTKRYAQYTGGITIRSGFKSTTSRSNTGYWELNLEDTDNMDGARWQITFTYNNKHKSIIIDVPEQDSYNIGNVFF